MLKCPECEGSKLEVNALVSERGPERNAVTMVSHCWLPITQSESGEFTGGPAQRWDPESLMRCVTCGYQAEARDFGLGDDVEINFTPNLTGLQAH